MNHSMVLAVFLSFACFGAASAQDNALTKELAGLEPLIDLQRLANQPADLVVIETISNPRVRVTDIGRLAELTHRSGGRLLVDNTFASHLLLRPLELGADLCMESLTKIDL